MNRTRVKICGITRPDDALAAIDAGADAIGLVFWKPSPRSINLQQARLICAQIPAFVSVVALTVNADSSLLQQLANELPIDLFQYHGDESPEQCQQLGRPYIKALRMQPELNLHSEMERFSSARSILLDAYKKGVPGGTGEVFNWQLIPTEYRSRIVLAGGLTSVNIERAITEVRPYAVDVSGGVELSAGIKDRVKIEYFLSGVDRADRAANMK